MNLGAKSWSLPVSRRTFLVASGTGLAGLTFGPLRAAESGARSESVTGGRAKSTILFFLAGGASHIDTWDLKPHAPLEYRGPFQPIETSAPGVRFCEHLPLLSRQAHRLAVVNSISGSVNTNDHHAGYYYNLTGHVPDLSFRTLGNNRTPFPDDWPHMGSVVAQRRPPHRQLPNLIALPQKEGAPAYTRPGQFAGKLGVEWDPFYVEASGDKPLQFRVPNLVLEGDLTAARIGSRRTLLNGFDQARRAFEETSATALWQRHHERAFSLLQAATTTAFDVASEPEPIRRRYGPTINGTSLLLARRLVEAGVPFVTVFWQGNDFVSNKCKSGGGWDTHGNNFNCLKEDLLPEFDRGFSALVEDLAERGMLDSTLLLVTSEMGRRPMIGDPRSGGVNGAGRDHWTHCLTDLLAGGGVRGGMTYGSSDRFAEYPSDHPVTPADITKSVYHAMGITNLEAYDAQNRPYNLLPEGEPILGLF